MYDPDNDALGWPRIPVDVVQGGQQVQQILAALEAGDAAAAQKMLQQASPGIRRMIGAAMNGGGNGNIQAAAHGLCPPIFEYTCGDDNTREHRSPAIRQTKVFSLDVDTTANSNANVDLVAAILADIFPSADSRKFFWPKDSSDGTQRAKTLGRGLIGVGFEWSLRITSLYTPAANGATPYTETKIWTQEEVAPIIQSLNQCEAGVYKSSTADAHINELELGWYGPQGKYFPRNLARHCVWIDEQAHVKVSNPGTISETVLVGATGTYYVRGSLTALGIFVHPDGLAGYFSKPKKG